MNPKPKDCVTLNARLENFVKYFVQEFEAKLLVYQLILEGELKNAGEDSNTDIQILSTGLGGAAGGLAGSCLGATSELATSGEQVGKRLTNHAGKLFGNKKGTEKVNDLIRGFQTNKNELRLELVKAGVDVFQSFEMQFLRVDKEKGSEHAMKQLAMDASSRALDYYVQNGNDSIAEGVLLGGSKLEPSSVVPVSCTIFNSSGLEITYKGLSSDEKWQTGFLYAKVGVVIEGNSPGEMRYYEKKDGTSEIDKYGYRRLLTSEKWTKLKKEYRSCNLVKGVKFRNYQFSLSSKVLEQKSNDILKMVNDEDKGLEEERLQELLKDMRDGVIKNLHLRKENENVLENMILKKLNSEECRKKVANQSTEEMKQGSEETRNLIAASQKEITEIFQESTHKANINNEGNLVEVKNNLEEINQIGERKPFTKERVWFEVKDLVTSFTGRQEELKEISTGLQEGMFVISGLDGVGKSELAIKYARDKYKNKGSVIWIDAETSETVRKSFYRLSEMLKIHKSDENAEEKETIKSIIEEVCKRFSDETILLIYDNAENYSKIEKFLPSGLPDNAKKPCVLVTSPDRSEWKAGRRKIKTLSLTGFTDAEAIEFIKKYLSIKDDLQNEDIGNLTKKLNNFPFALQQSVVYIKDKNESYQKRNLEYNVSNYLNEYEENPKKLLEVCLPSDMKVGSIFKDLDVILHKINKREFGQESLDMLNIISYFAPDNIPEEMFLNGLAGGNLKKLISITNLLEKYSIVNLKKAMLCVHGLVQQVRRLDLAERNEEEETLAKALNLLKENMKYGKDIHCYSPHIRSAWNYARKYDKLIERFLVEDTDDKEPHASFLNIIAEGSSYQVVESILKMVEQNHPDKLCKVINAEDKANGIPLHNAALNGDERIMKILIEKGANVKAVKTESHCWTPLHLAAKNGFLEVVIALLDKEVNVNEKTGYDFTALHFAARNGYSEIVMALIAKNADVKAEDQNKFTPLHYAVKNNHSEVVLALLEDDRINVNAQTKGNLTPLHFAARYANTGIVKALLEKGAKVNMKNKDKFTSLHYAAVYNRNEIVTELLRERDIDVNAETSKGNTALHLAAEKNNLEIVTALIGRDADVNKKNKEGYTASDLARKTNSIEIEHYIRHCEIKEEVSKVGSGEE